MLKMSKLGQIHLRAVMLYMSKMSKIDQIHLRAVMLCMSKMLKMGKEHRDIFFIIPFLIWYHLNVMLSMSNVITSLIFNGFSI